MNESVFPEFTKTAETSAASRQTLVCSVPPFIADIPVNIPPVLAQECEETEQDAKMRAANSDIEVCRAVEAAASCRIEGYDSPFPDIAETDRGLPGNRDAERTVQTLNALRKAETDQHCDTPAVLRWHGQICSHETFAGQIREGMVGIQSADGGLAYVAPPVRILTDLLADWERFARREDLPFIAAAAIAHAQFESIHPFPDGNGRVGRAAVWNMFARRGVCVPVSEVFWQNRQGYYDILGAYQTGGEGVENVIVAFCDAVSIASQHCDIASPEAMRNAIADSSSAAKFLWRADQRR